MTDNVNHPEHYTQHPSGVECIQVTEHMGFCPGNAIKYIWRHEQKGGVEDLKKARWYLDREIKRLENENVNETDFVEIPGPLNEHCNRWWQEEPEYLYRHIPVNEQQDEAWESKAPSDVPPMARRYDPKHG